MKEFMRLLYKYSNCEELIVEITDMLKYIKVYDEKSYKLFAYNTTMLEGLIKNKMITLSGLDSLKHLRQTLLTIKELF